MDNNTGKTMGYASVILGAITFGIQIMGGLCCGWVGWPLGIAAVICGILAIVNGEKALGAIGIILSVIGIVLQILALGAGTAGLMQGAQQSGY